MVDVARNRPCLWRTMFFCSNWWCAVSYCSMVDVARNRPCLWRFIWLYSVFIIRPYTVVAIVLQVMQQLMTWWDTSKKVFSTVGWISKIWLRSAWTDKTSTGPSMHWSRRNLTLITILQSSTLDHAVCMLCTTASKLGPQHQDGMWMDFYRACTTYSRIRRLEGRVIPQHVEVPWCHWSLSTTVGLKTYQCATEVWPFYPV